MLVKYWLFCICCHFIQVILGYIESKSLSWKPGFRMCADWELAERNAWRETFDKILDGCLFHFCKQAHSPSSFSFYIFSQSQLEKSATSRIVCSICGGWKSPPLLLACSEHVPCAPGPTWRIGPWTPWLALLFWGDKCAEPQNEKAVWDDWRIFPVFYEYLDVWTFPKRRVELLLLLRKHHNQRCRVHQLEGVHENW